MACLIGTKWSNSPKTHQNDKLPMTDDKFSHFRPWAVQESTRSRFPAVILLAGPRSNRNSSALPFSGRFDEKPLPLGPPTVRFFGFALLGKGLENRSIRRGCQLRSI